MQYIRKQIQEVRSFCFDVHVTAVLTVFSNKIVATINSMSVVLIIDYVRAPGLSSSVGDTEGYFSGNRSKAANHKAGYSRSAALEQSRACKKKASARQNSGGVHIANKYQPNPRGCTFFHPFRSADFRRSERNPEPGGQGRIFILL